LTASTARARVSGSRSRSSLTKRLKFDLPRHHVLRSLGRQVGHGLARQELDRARHGSAERGLLHRLDGRHRGLAGGGRWRRLGVGRDGDGGALLRSTLVDLVRAPEEDVQLR